MRMKCPKCNFVQSDKKVRCLKCGIIFERDQTPTLHKGASIPTHESPTEERDFFQDVVFFVEPRVNPFYFGGRLFVFLVLLLWGWKFILTPMGTNYAGNSFFHLVNLPFHEAGHLFFQVLGRWMTSLGGTLGQLLIPVACLLVLLAKTKDPFGASISLWWLGESFMDIAPYINDARNQELVLLGGITGREADYGYHDWEYILNEVGLLRYDHTLAYIAHGFGIVLMLLSFAWGGYVLLKQYRHLDLA
jgi:hypothetical protein